MEKKSVYLRLLVVCGLVVTLFALSLTYAGKTQANGDLPPRDTGVPTPEPEPEPEPEVIPASSLPDGGAIEMQVAFSADWPWDQMHWKDLWLEVEWTDGESWFKVDGWRGNPDAIVNLDGVWTAQKAWWVATKDLGTGPLRWVVYDHEGGSEIAMSEEFKLPAERGQAKVVQVSVAP